VRESAAHKPEARAKGGAHLRWRFRLVCCGAPPRLTRDLEALKDEARPALRRALADNPSAEVRKRLEELLSRPALLPPGEALRRVRAVEVLERLGTPEARRLLGALAGGEPEARLTREAQAALRRLAERAAPGKPGG
jgi:hypothetical protein